MSNDFGQMKASLSELDEIYTPIRFHSGEIRAEKIKILTEIQAKVDSIMGRKIYSDMWE